MAAAELFLVLADDLLPLLMAGSLGRQAGSQQAAGRIDPNPPAHRRRRREPRASQSQQNDENMSEGRLM
jgi:hypothetical protein